MKRTIVISDVAQSFIDSLPLKAQQKIYFNVFKVEEGIIDKEIFKKLDGTEIWELRTLFNGICYRLLAFWDTAKGALVIVTHGFVKKTLKTPKKEIVRAEAIMKYYFDNNTKS